MAERLRLPFDPDAELFRWGPIPGRLLSISHWVDIFSDHPKRFHHYIWPPTLILMQRKNILGIADMRALERVGANMFRNLIIGKRNRRARAAYREQTESLMKESRAVESLPLRAVGNSNLMRRWISFNGSIRRWWVVGVIPELGGYGGQAILRKQLHKEGLSEQKFHDAYATLAATDKTSFYQEEEISLARLLRFRPDSTSEQGALERHARRYAWIGNSYFRTHEEPLANFRRRLREMRRTHVTPALLRAKLNAHAHALRKSRQRILQNIRSRELRRISAGVGQCVWWQDQRKAVIFQYLAAVDRLAREIERRAGVPTGTYDNSYYWEVTLQPSTRILRLLKDRQHRFASRFTGKPDADYAPRDARRIIRDLWNPSRNASRELYGIPTYATKTPVRARVFIVRNHNDLVRFPKGAVLVAAMTAPEYVVAMRRASAIVTDTGGITSHAAIVSRELKKPCIVGTKHATQVLKNGDRVEVDAVKGIVKKI